MKVHHVVIRAIQSPKPGKSYGARVEDIRLNGASVTVGWAIFAHKPRAKKGKADAKRS